MGTCRVEIEELAHDHNSSEVTYIEIAAASDYLIEEISQNYRKPPYHIVRAKAAIDDMVMEKLGGSDSCVDVVFESIVHPDHMGDRIYELTQEAIFEYVEENYDEVSRYVP